MPSLHSSPKPPIRFQLTWTEQLYSYDLRIFHKMLRCPKFWVILTEQLFRNRKSRVGSSCTGNSNKYGNVIKLMIIMCIFVSRNKRVPTAQYTLLRLTEECRSAFLNSRRPLHWERKLRAVHYNPMPYTRMQNSKFANGVYHIDLPNSFTSVWDFVIPLRTEKLWQCSIRHLFF